MADPLEIDRNRVGARIALALGSLLCAQCASPQAPEPPMRVEILEPDWLPADSHGVHGRIVLSGEAPEREVHELDDEMAELVGALEYVDETWLVCEGGGLANCVVQLRPLFEAETLEPLENALYEKVGCTYEPRVLAIPVGTTVTLRNRDSCCRGFHSYSVYTQFNTMLEVGDELEVTFERAEAAPISCDLREYMRGAIVAVDSRHYAVTDEHGGFSLTEVPAGRYRMRIWHEGLGWVTGLEPRDVTIWPGVGRLEIEVARPVDSRRGSAEWKIAPVAPEG